MKSFGKITSLILIFLCVSLWFPMEAYGKTVVDTGSMGGNVRFTIYSDGEMVIEGSGKVRQGNFDKDITSLVVSEGITAIGDYVFSYCERLEKVYFPQSLLSVGTQSFLSSGLTEVYIPENVSQIGEMAFSDCHSLQEFEVSASNQSFSSCNGVLFNHDKTVLVSFPGAKGGKYEIPVGVLSVGDYAFYRNENLSFVSFPEGISQIGIEAFAGSGLLEISVPHGVSVFGVKAFEGCKALERAFIGVSPSDFAFYNCTSLKEVYFSSYVSEVGAYAFYDCDCLEKIRLPESLSKVGERAFSNCNKLEDIIVPSQNLQLGEKPFGYDWSTQLKNTVFYGISSSMKEYCLNKFKLISTKSDDFIFTTEDVSNVDGFLIGIGENTSEHSFSLVLANGSYALSKCENGILGTGCTVSLESGKTATVIINGDTDGNGKVDSTDYLRVKKAFLGEVVLENSFLKAADTDGDNLLTSTDYMRIKSHFLGSFSLGIFLLPF